MEEYIKCELIRGGSPRHFDTFFPRVVVEKWSSHRCSMEHLEASATKIIMRGPLYFSYA